MTTMAGTWTFPGRVSVVYVEVEVRCRGKYHGDACDRLLARRLVGEVELKCPRCKTIHTYRRKPVDE